LHRRRLVRDAETMHVEVEMVADRHRVAHDHLVVRIGAGVDLCPGAHIAPRHEVARIDEADHRFDRARALLDILRGYGWGGGHGCSPVILSFVMIVPCLGALASVLALRSIKAGPRRLRHTLPEFEGETTMKYVPILALAPVILLAACGSARSEEVLETVR